MGVFKELDLKSISIQSTPDSFYIYSSPCDTCAGQLAKTTATNGFTHKALCFTKLWIGSQTTTGYGYESPARAMQALRPMQDAGFVIKQFPNPWDESNQQSDWFYPSSLTA